MSTLVEHARALSERLGAPVTNHEDWRYVDLKGYAEWQPDKQNEVDHAKLIAAAGLPGADVVLIDGRIVVDDGITEAPADAIEQRWQERLETCDLSECWSLARPGDCRQLTLRGSAERALVIVNIITGGSSGWRLAIEAAAGTVADLTIAHLHLGRGDAACTLDCVAGSDAVLRVDELDVPVAGGSIGRHCVTKHLRAATNTHIMWTTASPGGELVRHAAWAHLDGEHGEILLAGANALHGKDQAHNLVRMQHHVGNARSRQVFKTVVYDETQVSFDGIIHVDEGADGTDALQASNNLQLSPKARVATRPQLDIYTDDVVASHGATVGQPDEDELFYLRSRGLDQQRALQLVVGGYMMEALEHVHSDADRTLAASSLLGH